MYTIYMTIDMVYNVLAKGFEIRRQGSEMTKYKLSKDGKQLLEGRRLLDRKSWVEFPASMNSYDLVAKDWEIVPKDINK